jgi:putative redox protein
MRAELRYVGKGLQFEGVTESKFTQRMDDTKNGNERIGPSPVELVLQSLVGCSAMDVVSILEKMRRTISDLRISVDAERREEYPRVFTKIHLTYILTSPDVNKNEFERAVKLSQDKYCSVAGMLRPMVNITYSIVLQRS